MDPAIRFIEDIIDYLVDPEKIRRGEMIINRYKKITNRCGKYSDDEVRMKLEFEGEFFQNSSAPIIISGGGGGESNPPS